VVVSPLGSGTEVSDSPPEASGHGVVAPGVSRSCPGSKSCSVASVVTSTSCSNS
jgi:hypothetical protein